MHKNIPISLCIIPSCIMISICYNGDSQGNTAKVEHKRDNIRAGTEKLERNAQRARCSEPPAAEVPKQKKSVLQAVGSTRRTQPQKGSRSVYHAPLKIERGISMSNTEIQSKVNELRELRRMADELAAEIEAAQDAIKAHMTAIDADTLTGVDYKITWKSVTSSRFDSTAFKKAMPELAERFTKSTTSRRFVVA